MLSYATMEESRRHFIRFWLPVVVYLGLIFVLSSIPVPSLVKEDIPSFDKLLHTIEYAVLGFLLVRGLKNSRLRLSRRNCILVAAALATFYGMSDELHQYFVPHRQASLWDVFFDCIGSIMGSLIYRKST